MKRLISLEREMECNEFLIGKIEVEINFKG